MKDASLWVAFAALLIAGLSMMFQRQAVQLQGGSGGLTLGGNQGPTFNFGTGVNGMAAQPVPTLSTGSCGCGGSFGDYAVPRINPIYGASIKTLPYVTDPRPLPETFPGIIGNGAAA